MSRFAALLVNDLRRRVRNRSAIVTAAVAPLAMAVVFSLLIGGGDDASFVIGVAVDRSGDSLADTIVGSLVEADSGPVEFRRIDDSATMSAQVDEGSLDAALILPQNLGRPTPARIVVLRSPDRRVSASIAESTAESIRQRLDRTSRALSAASALGVAIDADVAAQARSLESSIAVGTDQEAGKLSPAAFFGASMSMVFLFFTVGYAGTSLHVERRNGTLDRVLSTPTSAALVVAAKSATVALLGMAGFMVVWAVTTVGFDGRWGPSGAVLLVIVATTLAISGVATLAVSFARTEQQTDALAGGVAFALAILGGNFVGPGQSPELLKRVASFTPNGWALRTFTDLATGASTMSSVVSAVAALLGFAVLCGGWGLVRMRRLLTR